MTSDGHDTSVTQAGSWTASFLTPLLNNTSFMNNTLVLVTFDENHTYTLANRVMAILLGDVIPSNLVGTTDSNFYNHYSELSTVEANWGLHTLGRFDVGANVFSLVANATGDKLRSWSAITADTPTVFLNESYAGPFNSENSSVPWPHPNIHAVVNGRTVLPSIQQAWGTGPSIYTTGVKIPDGLNPPAEYQGKQGMLWDVNEVMSSL